MQKKKCYRCVIDEYILHDMFPFNSRFLNGSTNGSQTVVQEQLQELHLFIFTFFSIMFWHFLFNTDRV